MSKPYTTMITARVTCDTGKTWITSINGTEEAVRGYFLWHLFTDENPETGKETHHRVTSVEFLEREAGR
jgi:hypothetical protein